MNEMNRIDTILSEIGKETREIIQDMTAVIIDIQRIQERGEALCGGSNS